MIEENIRGTFPDSKTIKCKDCVYRDRTVVVWGGVKKEVGVTRANCLKYKNQAGKPSDVLFYGGDCKYYVKDVE